MGKIYRYDQRDHQSLAVLKALELRRDELLGDVACVIFDNGRERGFTIRENMWVGGPEEVSFAEYRSSDDIVVYPYARDQGTEEEREHSYKTKTRYFPMGSFERVVDFLVLHLNRGMLQRKIKLLEAKTESPDIDEHAWATLIVERDELKEKLAEVSRLYPSQEGHKRFVEVGVDG